MLKDTVSLKQDAESPLNTNLPFVYENSVAMDISIETPQTPEY